MQLRRRASARVDVDMDRCVYTLQCTYHAPAVFDVNDDGEMTYTEEITAETEEAVDQAVDLCPSRAIHITRISG